MRRWPHNSGSGVPALGADASCVEEPGAGILHAGICEGAARATGGSTSTTSNRSRGEMLTQKIDKGDGEENNESLILR